jgi:DNA polymerase-3 subunit beta
VLNGCHFKITEDSILLVSCDSFKLAKCSAKTDIENNNSDNSGINFSFIIPSKTMIELYKLLSDGDDTVRVYMSRKNIVFVLENTVFFSRLIDGEYIDYDRIIIKNHRIITTATKSSLISALERAALVTEERIAGSVRSHVKLDFDADTLKITAASSAGSIYDEVIIGHEGDGIVIAFNNRYLIDSLRACSSDMVKISLTSPLSSINIEALGDDDNETELFMLLPVRMKE